tara:strand:+ start:6426 stop:6980 length:555 start_codon:yes stop_codon:yes gene_type:complete
MACDLTGGRKKPCKDAVGGVVKVHFVDFGDLATVTVGSSDEITDISGTFNYSTYDVKGNSSLESNINSSIENGTTFFEQVTNLTLHKMTKEDNKELKLMTYGRPHVFVQTFDNKVLLVGREHGAEVTGGTAVTGTAMGDLNGYTLTLTANETTLPNFVDGATDANPFAGMASASATETTQRDPA